MPIPWDKVILHGPQVLDLAKGLYGKWQTRPKQAETEFAPQDEIQTQLNKLALRMKSLEEAGEKQAALATELAEQDQALSEGVTLLKTQFESLQKEMQDLKSAHGPILSRLDELRIQHQEAHANATKLHRKLAFAILFSAFALALSAFAAARIFLA